MSTPRDRYAALEQENSELRRRCRLLTGIIQGASSAIFATDHQHRYILANDAYARYLGRTPSEILGKTHHEVFPAREADRFVAANDAIMAERQGRHGVEEVLGRVFDVAKHPLLDERGESSGVCGLVGDITERCRLDESLRLQAEILANMKEGVVMVAADDGEIVYANPRFAEMLGYEPGELHGRNVAVVNAATARSPEDVAREIMARLRQDGGWTGEVLNRRKDGTEVWSHACVSTFRHAMAGEVWVSVHQDITRRKRAEAETSRLQQMEQWLHAGLRAINACPDLDAAAECLLERALGAGDFDGGAVYLIEGDEAVIRHARGLDPALIAGVRHRSLETGYVREVLSHPGEVVDVVRRFPEQSRVGQPFGIRHVSSVALLAGGRPFGVLVLASRRADPPEPAAAERVRVLIAEVESAFARLESENRLRVILTTMAEGVIFCGPEGRLVECNPGAERILGLSRAELHGRSLLETKWGAVHEDGRPFPGDEFPAAVALRTGKPCTEVVLGLDHPTGLRRWIRINATPLWRTGDRRPHGVVTSFADITEQRRMEKVCRDEQARESLGRLAGSVAHEFNNVVAAMVLKIHLAQSEAPGAAVARSLDDLEVLCRRSTGVVQGLLAFTRQSVLRPELLDLVPWVSGQIPALRSLLGDGIELVVRCAPSLPRVRADRSCCEQVLRELCRNAGDAMPAGGVVRVTLEAVDFAGSPPDRGGQPRVGRHVRLEVRDSGSGMDDRVMQRLFEPFFTTKGVGLRTGLGLATVRGLIEQQHGWVEVESEPGRGSTFRVFLPEVPGAVAPASATGTSRVPAGKPAAGGRGPTVLLVEDEQALRTATRTLLERSGFLVLEASNADAAWALWSERSSEIDLLYSDVVMPGGVGGLELAERLLAARPGLKVILTSGYHPDLLDMGSMARLGITFLPKPCPARSILAALHGCLAPS